MVGSFFIELRSIVVFAEGGWEVLVYAPIYGGSKAVDNSRVTYWERTPFVYFPLKLYK